uniref:Secreted protein n=1 Tax=Ascaris lumbricoides TaxID=6252 RepID=A0A0M3HZL2_ASCLU
MLICMGCGPSAVYESTTAMGFVLRSSNCSFRQPAMIACIVAALCDHVAHTHRLVGWWRAKVSCAPQDFVLENALRFALLEDSAAK